MVSEQELNELAPLCTSVREYAEGGLVYIYLEKLKLPPTYEPQEIDALLCLGSREGYPTRLYFAEKLSARTSSPQPLNWNASGVLILQKQWYAYSWIGVQPGRPIEVLAQHMKGLW